MRSLFYENFLEPMPKMAPHRWIPLLSALFLLAGITTATDCLGEFHKRCSCGLGTYEGVTRYITNCTNTGFQDPFMLKSLAIDTEVLIFTGNNVSSLPPNLFGDDIDYKKLTVIDLSNNNITEIQGKAFHHIPNVKKLILNRNKWRVENHSRLFANLDVLEELFLNEAMDVAAPDYIDYSDRLYNRSIDMLMSFFKENPLKNIKKIHLESNGIGPSLDMDVFCSLQNLEEVDVANNSISRLVWTDNCLHRLRHLNLSGNHIPYLGNETLHNLDDIEDVDVDLTNNELDCDCGITDFYVWLHETSVNVIDKEFFTCEDGYPEDNAGQILLHIPRELLQCQKQEMIFRHIGIAHVVLVIVIVLIVSLLSVVAFMNRRIIGHTVRLYGEPLYRRMQYSTIQKQEAEREMEI